MHGSSRQDSYVKLAVWSLSKAILVRGVSIFPHTFTNFSHCAQSRAQSRAQSSTHNASSSIQLQSEVSINQEPYIQELTCCEIIPRKILPVKFNTLTILPLSNHENLTLEIIYFQY